MTYYYSKYLKSLQLIGIVLLVICGFGYAQEKSEPLSVKKESATAVFSLQSVQNYVFVNDSIGMPLMLKSASLNGAPIWIRKKVNDDVVENTIQWEFNNQSRQLIVDLRGMRDGGEIELEIIPKNSRIDVFQLSLSTAENEVADKNALQVLNNVRFVKNQLD